MRTPLAALALLAPALVVAAPSAKPATDIAGFTRGAPFPKWLQPAADIPRTERTDPVVIRLSETQAWVGAVPAEHYNSAIQVNDAAELGVIGQFGISYFAQYQKLSLHRVMILRGEQKLDRTASVSIRPLQRETGIESGMLGGATTVQLLLDDVRVGDTLWISYTVEGENPVFGKRWTGDYHIDSSNPTELRRITVLHPQNRPVVWRQLGDFQSEAVTPRIDTVGDVERLRFEVRALEAVEGEPSVPADYMPFRGLQFSEYKDWGDVASWANSLFPPVEASPALKALAQQFRSQGDASAQAAAALHWVQNEVRYFSVSIGENSHRPQAPDVVLKRRYGDCKDKSYLLVSLLRELGLSARPLLLSANAPKVAAKLLPTPSWFDHVIVQITIDGHDYFVDPTRTNQPEPLSSMPQAFPAASVLPVDDATHALMALPERSETLPTFEHVENFVIADFTGAALLETHDIYRSTYADGMRQYYPRLSSSEQKKSLLAGYEKLYPGVTLDGAPSYQDNVADNVVEVVSRYKLPKAIKLKDKVYQLDFHSKIIEGTLGIPSKLVRNFPFELAGGRYTGRYRIHIHWPAAVRNAQPTSVKQVDNPFFELKTEHAFRGSDADYQVDYRLKQRSIAAADLPQLQEEAKQLDEYVESTMQLDQRILTSAILNDYSYRDLDSLRQANSLQAQREALSKKKEGEITLAEACGYLQDALALREFIDWNAMQLARQLEHQVSTSDKQPGYAQCSAQLAFASSDYSKGANFLARANGIADDAPLTQELAWGQLYAGDKDAAVATMARYTAAHAKALPAGQSDLMDAASQIALLQRAGYALPPELLATARANPDGPWPRPLLAMQAGAISSAQLLQKVEAMSPDAQSSMLNEAWFYIGQARLAAGDRAGALQAFRWFNINGLRNAPLSAQARMEYKLLAPAPMNVSEIPKDVTTALRWVKQGAEQGKPDAQTLLSRLYDQTPEVPPDPEQSLAWLRKAAEQDESRALHDLGLRYLSGKGVEQNDKEALRLMRRSAEQGYSDAMAELASMYRNAQGTAQDYGQAEFWNRRALVYGNVNAMYNLALAYDFGEGLKQDFVKAAALYRGAAEKGIADAQLNLGVLYYRGTGVKEDKAEAARWYHKAADQGSDIAMRNLAYLYMEGEGVARDMAKGVDYYRKCVALGDSDAMVSLALLYESGKGVPRDVAQTRELYLKAAALNNANAEYNLALLYHNGGDGLEADLAQAMQWYSKSAEHGDADGQFALAHALANGIQLAMDQKAAVQWYEKAAAQGSVKAQSELGQMYLNGWGTPVDPGKAVGLFRQAAEQGDMAAQTNLAYAYELGRGLNKDEAQAITWYEKATQQGGVYAQVRLANLYLTAQPPLRAEDKGRALMQSATAQTSTDRYFTLEHALRSIQDLDGAEQAAQHALELAEKSGDQKKVRIALEYQSAFYYSTNQFDKAIAPQLRRIALLEQSSDVDAPRMASDFSHLGDMYQTLGKFSESEQANLRALDLLERKYGADSPEVAELVLSMGNLYTDSDQFAKAELYLQRALTIYEKTPTQHRSSVGYAKRNLARVRWAQGRNAEAEALLQAALEISRQERGEHSFGTASVMNSLADLYNKMGKYDQAAALLERAVPIAEEYSEQSPLTDCPFKNNLAYTLIGKKQYARAEQLVQYTLATRERVLGKEYADVAYSLHYMGVLYLRQKQYGKAEPLLQRALAIREHTYGPDYSEVGEVLQDLGDLYREQGQYAQAEPLLQRALKIRTTLFGSQHLDLQKTRASLADLYRRTSREQAAAELERRVKAN